MNNRYLILFFSLLLLLVVTFLLQLFVGSVTIPVGDVLHILFGSNQVSEVWRNIIIESRLPGALAALFAGAGLAVSGLQMQTMFRNPVAGPYVLGISAGASLGVAVLILASGFIGYSAEVHQLSGIAIIAAAAFGSVAVFLINFFISFRVRDVVAILIIGLMIGGGISSLIEILQAMSGNEALKQYVIWTFGSFRYVNSTQVVYLSVFVVFGILLALGLSKSLNALMLGDTYASSLGLHVQRSKVWIVFCTSILAGSVTAFCGPIGFVGLAVPHLARSIFKSADHLVLTPACALLGGAVCCVCNVIAGAPGSDFILPVNAITSLLGAPVVIWVILKQKRM